MPSDGSRFGTRHWEYSHESAEKEKVEIYGEAGNKVETDSQAKTDSKEWKENRDSHKTERKTK